MTRRTSLSLALLAFTPVFAAKHPATLNDGAIQDQVRIKLAGDADVRGGNIDVQVQNGVVTLKGRVESDKQKKKAEHLARKVKGVVRVDNQITVGPR